MPILRQRRDKALDRLGKAHVEHLVGFIQNQRFKLGQVAEALLDQIQQAPRCGHDDVYTGLERIDLMELADAAENRRHARLQVPAKGIEHVGDLRDKFAGRREDQDSRATLGSRAGIGGEAVQQRQREGGQKGAVGPFDDKTTTLADQLTGVGRTWKAYVEGATAGLAAGANPCDADPATQPRNPFLRFATITGAAECGSSIAEPAQLATDVADSDSAPAFSYIVPGPAHDGSTSLADADAWLKATLPTILDSKAYADGGLVIVTFDAGAPADVEAGGGRVGALLLSQYVTAGATVEAPYDPYSLLGSIEGLFGLDPIGYAAKTTLKPFGPEVFAAWDPKR